MKNIRDMSKLVGNQQFDGDVYIDGAMGYEIGGDTDAASPVNEALNKLAAVDRRPILYARDSSEISDYVNTYGRYPDISNHPCVYFEDLDEWGILIQPNYSDNAISYILSNITDQLEVYLEDVGLTTHQVFIKGVYRIYEEVCLDNHTINGLWYVFVLQLGYEGPIINVTQEI